MASTTHKPGMFMRIPLADGSYGYGRLLQQPYAAFYDYRTTEPSDDLDAIERQPILFRVAILISGLRKWTPLGVRPLAGEAAAPLVFFQQNPFNPLVCSIYDTLGNDRNATPEECVGLERSAVWEPRHVEQRLLDRFMGRPNETEIHLRVRLTPP